MRKEIEFSDDDEVMRECRRVRDELNKRFKTVSELCAWAASLDKQAGKRRGVRSTSRTRKTSVTSSVARRRTVASASRR